LIHGVGVHPANWWNGVVEQIDQLGSRYATVSVPPSKEVDFVGITYDDVFDAQLQRWDQDLAQLKASALFPQVKDALSWLDGATERSFVWTYIGDVVLFLVEVTRMAVVARVTAALADVISKKSDGDTEFSIIAHSLGTAVAMEAVNALATPAPGIGWPGLPPGFLFREIVMVANTSRLLQRKGLQAYTESRLLPRRYAANGLCVTYRNVFHRLDPIPWVRGFDLQANESSGYFRFAVEHYYARNIHSIEHYLEHPAVHGPILRLPDPNNLPANDLKAAIDQYYGVKRFGGEFEKVAEVDQYIDELKSIPKPDPENETELVNQLRYVVDALKSML
jgi:hypothetical protein